MYYKVRSKWHIAAGIIGALSYAVSGYFPVVISALYVSYQVSQAYCIGKQGLYRDIYDYTVAFCITTASLLISRAFGLDFTLFML